MTGTKALIPAALACLVAGSSLTGCSKGNEVTPAEQAQFKNPAKEIPPEARQRMAEKAREAQMKMQQQMQQQSPR